mgnify:CR=1 FL=1
MKFKFITSVFAVVVFTISSISGIANAGLINFEDLSPPTSGAVPIPVGYNDIDWGTSSIFNAAGHFSVGAQTLTALTGGAVSGFNPFSTFELKLLDGGLFDFDGGIFVSLFGSQTLSVQGWRDGVGLVSFSNLIDDTSFWPVNGALYKSIDTLRFVSSNGNQVIFDNLQISRVDVPEPSTLAIFALGMMGLASRRFKKQC